MNTINHFLNAAGMCPTCNGPLKMTDFTVEHGVMIFEGCCNNSCNTTWAYKIEIKEKDENKQSNGN